MAISNEIGTVLTIVAGSSVLIGGLFKLATARMERDISELREQNAKMREELSKATARISVFDEAKIHAERERAHLKDDQEYLEDQVDTLRNLIINKKSL